MARLAALCVIAVIVTAGCGGVSTPTMTDGPTGDTPTETIASGSPTQSTAPATATPSVTPTDAPGDGKEFPEDDPNTDVIGWENGYWHNESIAVNNTDGLNTTEFDRVLARTMARVELIRRLEFDRTVEFDFITRETLREQSPFRFAENDYRDVFWEAAFAIGENQSSAAALEELYDVVVDGYAYSSDTRAKIVMVQADPQTPRVDPLVLAHELSHALAGVPRVDPLSEPITEDESLALRSEEEGQASWVDSQYEQRCGRQWDCIQRPDTAETVPTQDVNMGLYLWFAAPYTLGQQLVADQYERNGVEGVKEVQRYPPESMEQVIHPTDYRADSPTEVTITDRTSNGWDRLSRRTGEFGEAILYVMLRQGGVIETDSVTVTVDQQTGLNYTHPATAGWDGDVFVPYTNGSAHGYVLKSVWESDADAEEFATAYRRLLRNYGADRVATDVWVIESGQYADAFRVERRGDSVLIVNAPTVAALADVHAGGLTNAST